MVKRTDPQAARRKVQTEHLAVHRGADPERIAPVDNNKVTGGQNLSSRVEDNRVIKDQDLSNKAADNNKVTGVQNHSNQGEGTSRQLRVLRLQPVVNNKVTGRNNRGILISKNRIPPGRIVRQGSQDRSSRTGRQLLTELNQLRVARHRQEKVGRRGNRGGTDQTARNNKDGIAPKVANRVAKGLLVLKAANLSRKRNDADTINERPTTKELWAA